MLPWRVEDTFPTDTLKESHWLLNVKGSDSNCDIFCLSISVYFRLGNALCLTCYCTANTAKAVAASVSKGTLGDDLKKGWEVLWETASRGPLNVWVSFTSAPAFDSLSSASLLKSLFNYYPPSSTAAPGPNVSNTKLEDVARRKLDNEKSEPYEF